MKQTRLVKNTDAFSKRFGKIEVLNQKQRRALVTIDVSEPERRSFGYEILSDSLVEDMFISSGRAPVLENHTLTSQIGVVEAFDFQNGIITAEVRFSPRGAGKRVFHDILDGMVRDASIGYSVKSGRYQNDSSVVVQWEPLQVSIMTIAYDERLHGRGFFEQARTPMFM